METERVATTVVLGRDSVRGTTDQDGHLPHNTGMRHIGQLNPSNKQNGTRLPVLKLTTMVDRLLREGDRQISIMSTRNSPPGQLSVEQLNRHDTYLVYWFLGNK
jgi:hypothetical protein